MSSTDVSLRSENHSSEGNTSSILPFSKGNSSGFTPNHQVSSLNFEFEGAKIRILQDESGDPWFVAKDVCEKLGLGNPSIAVNGNEGTGNLPLDADEKGIMIVQTSGGAQNLLCVSESGVFSLIFKSRKPEAKAFQKWVTGTVLPSIRKTGGYSVAPAVPQSLPEALRAYAAAIEEREAEAARRLKAEAQAAELAEQAAKDAPRLAFAAVVMSAVNSISLNATAKLLGLGQIRMMRQMRAWGILTLKNLPTQPHVEAGRFTTHESPYLNTRTGETKVDVTTDVTQRGLDYLRKRFAGEENGN